MNSNESLETPLTRRQTLKIGTSTALGAVIAGCADDDPGESETEADEATPEEADEADDASDSEPETDEEDSTDESDADENDAETQSLELLAEEDIDHEHACLHAEFDERTDLEAADTEDEADVVDETHVIWEVSYDGAQGYVTFDADAHSYDGPFVFYTADGSASPVVGDEEERGEVDDESCEPLDEYVQVAPEDGIITLELTAD